MCNDVESYVRTFVSLRDCIDVPNSQELVEDIILIDFLTRSNLPGPNLISPNPRLLDILSGESWDASRVEAAQRVEDLVEALIEAYQQMEMKNDETQRLLEGKWSVGTFVSNIFDFWIHAKGISVLFTKICLCRFDTVPSII